jgi:hypothetical protein
MASSRKTYDTEIITVRQVNAYNTNNSLIPALNVLTSDGVGGTFWAIPSTLGVSPAINTIIVDNIALTSDLSQNQVSINTGPGLGSYTDNLSKTTTLFSKGFTTFDVSGGNTINAYSNSIVSPTVKFVGSNGISISSDPLLGFLYFNGQNLAISTGIYGYSQINVTSNTADPSGNLYLTAQSPSTVLNVKGTGDILLTANVESNIFTIGISSFNSHDYLNISSIAYNSYGSTLSTVSSLFIDNIKGSSLNGGSISSLISTSAYLQTRLQNGETNVMQNYTNLDIFKLYSTNMNGKINQINLQTVSSTTFAATMYPSTLSTVSSLFIDNAKGSTISGQCISSLISTSASLQTNITNKTTQLNAGLISSISFASSININEFRGTLQGYSNSLALTLSSAALRLDSMSTMINAGAQVRLTMSPSLRFDFLDVSDNLYHISTYVGVGTSLIPSPFVRAWFSRGGTRCNLYTDTINFTFPANSLNNVGLTSTYTVYHRIESFTGMTFGATLNCNAQQLISGDNTLSVLLTGRNYTSIY